MPCCHNRSNDELSDGTRVTLHRIPADKATRKLWLSRLHNVRKNVTVNSDTRVCIVHFKDHELGNLPTIFPSKPEKVSCPRRQLIKYVADPPSIDPLPCHMPELGNISGYDMPSSDFCPTCGHSDADKLDKGTQHEIQMNTKDTQTSFNTSAWPDIHLEDLANQPADKVRFYTGFVNFSMLYLMFQTLLSHGADRLNYWRGEKSMGDRSYHGKNQQKSGTKRALRTEDEFLLTCMRLKLGLLQQYLADIFKVSDSTVSRILNTWINFIYG